MSAAAYAAAAGLPCRVLCGTGSGAGVKLAAAAAHGAHVQLVEGDYSAAYRCAAEGESDGWMNVSTTYRNPLLAEAYRGTALEIADDLGHVPDVVVVPVGAGPLLRGLLGGFTDLVVAGAAERVPRMVGVQAAACAPLVRAWESGAWLASLTDSLPVLPTRAAAIADSLRGYEREGLLTLAAVRDSAGCVAGADRGRHRGRDDGAGGRRPPRGAGGCRSGCRSPYADGHGAAAGRRHGGRRPHRARRQGADGRDRPPRRKG